MTKAEFLAKYGDVQVTFSYYYKFTFYYTSTLPDGKRLSVSVGGNGDDIYREEVSAGVLVPVSRLYPYEGYVYEGSNEIEGFYEY